MTATEEQLKKLARERKSLDQTIADAQERLKVIDKIEDALKSSGKQS